MAYEPGYVSRGRSGAAFFVPVERVQGELEPATPGVVTPQDPVAYSDFSRPQILHRGAWAPGAAPKHSDENLGAYVRTHPTLHVGVIWDPSRMTYNLPGLPHRESPPNLARATLHAQVIPSGRSQVPGLGSVETEPI